MSKTNVSAKKIDNILIDMDDQKLVVSEVKQGYEWQFIHVKKLFKSIFKDNSLCAIFF
tara:strand:+ start:1464 stop:1637 length:174 start_codon:yes stop_codon:yes gene_type:complete